ncbi:hypothetical protein ACFSQP_01150 [Bizionia sediminis]|uniref:Sugar transferase n=1 Tax=Bizionia sediminis TaxID=1737064 RepID=A0ABW5KPT7_9FLAO
MSERIFLLRLTDMLVVLGSLYFVGSWFQFNYFYIASQHWIWVFVLMVYLAVFGTIFELYDLNKASRVDKVLGNIVLTVTVVVLFYLLTPFLTPILPNNRLQIVYFFLAILVPLFL